MTENEKVRIAELRKKGMCYSAIGKELSIPMGTVKTYCRRNGVTKESVTCDNCGKPIIQNPKHKRRRFCCDSCRQKWWGSKFDDKDHKSVYKYICPVCGKKFQVYGNSKRKYCSHECYIKDRFGGRE